MTTPVPAPAGGSTDRRAVIGVLLVVLLLLLAAFGAFALGRSTGGSEPTAAPTPGSSGIPEPGPTVTVTASPAPEESLPSTGEDGGTTGGTGSDSGSTGSGDGSGSGTVDGGAARDFALTAALGGAPVLIGQRRDLTVTVRNPNPRALELISVEAAPRTPSAAGCRAAWVSVGSYVASRDGAVRVPARGQTTLTLTFELVDLASTNQNACQGSTFPLSLSGSGRLV